MLKHVAAVLVVGVGAASLLASTSAVAAEPFNSPVERTDAAALAAEPFYSPLEATDAAALAAEAFYSPLERTEVAALAAEAFYSPLERTEVAALAPQASVWTGQVRRAANVRRAPHTSAAIVRELAPGTPVRVSRWVAGEVVEPDNP